MLTAERLRKLFWYDLNTGTFWRLAPVRGMRKSVGYKRKKDGRSCMCVDGKHYLTSRLVWFYMTGRWPAGQIDHKDGDPANASALWLHIPFRSRRSA
jgi:HNH endonuclease